MAFYSLKIEIIGIFFIICTLFLLYCIQHYRKNNFFLKSNVDSLDAQKKDLENQLTNLSTSSQQRESQLHKNISTLQYSLREEQEAIKLRDKDLKLREAQLQTNLSETQKNLEEETESRKKVLSQKKSSEVRLGHIAETLAPFLDQFDFDPENCVFLGKPIDYISFDDDAITLIEVKSGKSQLNSKQRHIRDLIKSNQVNWKEIRIT